MLLTKTNFVRRVISIYRSLIVSDSPVSYWRLGEGSGTVAVDVMGNYDGTYLGVPTLGEVGALSGDIDTAVYFDGVNDDVSISINVLPDTGSFSIEGWFKHDGTNQIWLGRGKDTDPAGSSSLGWSILMLVSPTSVLNTIVLTSGGVNQVFIDVPGTYASGVYHHVVSVFVEGTGLYTYINGVQAGFAASTDTFLRPTATQGTWIGSGNPETLFSPGTIDDVAMYRYALSGAQILNHYEVGSGTTVSYSNTILVDNPQVYYELNEVTGDAIDATSNARTGVVNGTINQGVPALVNSVAGGTAFAFNSAGWLEISGFTNAYDNVSLETWFNLNAYPAAGTIGIMIGHIMYWASAPTDFPIHLGIDEFGNVVLSLSKGDDYTADIYLTVPVSLNTTYHVVTTFDGTTAKIYLNGVEVASAVNAMILSGYYGPWAIGRASVEYNGGVGKSWFDGTLDRPAIYSYALSSSQVANHYNIGKI